MARLGDTEGIAQIERPGWQKRCQYPGILRIKGWLLSQGRPRARLHCLARLRQHQQAKSWKLRSATRYARLICNQGRVRGAYDLLAAIYGWFTQGFGTKDLREAKALLGELRELAPQAAAAVTAVRDNASPG